VRFNIKVLVKLFQKFAEFEAEPQGFDFHAFVVPLEEITIAN